MNILIIIGLIFITSLVIFTIIVKSLDFLPSKYDRNIGLLQGIGFMLVISGAFITYYQQQQAQKEKEKSQYADTILQSFDKIEEFIIANYDDLSVVFDILYNKVQFPSSDIDLNRIFEQSSKKTKDILFVIFNKLTLVFEKIYLLNPELFENKNLGLRFRLYTDNIFYYEYWNTTKSLYNTYFVNYIDERFKYLTIADNIFTKPDRNIFRIPYNNDNRFMYASPKFNGSWK